MAEDGARELPNLSLEDALQPVKLFAERGSPKYEKAAMRPDRRDDAQQGRHLRRLGASLRRPGIAA
jgi:hypothetical protein